MQVYLLLLFCFAGRAVRTEPYNSSSLANDVVPALSGDFLLASEETPTRAPRPVTKQGHQTPQPSEDALFLTDCSEPLNKDIACSVHIVGCSAPIFDYVESGKEPPGAHDVRIAPTTKVIGSNRIDKRKHRLHVDVSWQIPQLDSSNNLRAFKLLVNGPDEKSTCFVFNVTHSQQEENVSPRYRFSSNSLFEFGRNYTVTIVSLPVSRSKSPKVIATSLMPDDPDEAPKYVKTHEEICAAKSNPQASKWAASFRKIFLFSAIRMIQIEFLAAPPQYCFEEYEVRLLDSSGIVMLQSAVISMEDLKTELINGRPVQFGEYNFTDIELDTDLIPSVIPIETGRDGRCLCETENGCSCLAADWKPVKLTKIEKPPSTNNRTLESDSKTEKGSHITGPFHWHSFAIVGVSCLAILFGILLCFGLKCYRHVHKNKKSSNIHLLNENPNFTQPGSIPLIMKQSMSILILYSHDSAQHEAAVLAFAELLRDVYHLNVHLDVWDEEDIEANRAEYINSSIVRAGKVIIINSIGAYFRTIARHRKKAALERIVAGRNDALFGVQIDLALQHPCVISCHFNYTNPKYVLFPVSRLLQYNIPENLMTLTTAIMGQSARAEHLAGFNSVYARLQAALSRKTHYIANEPQWFENTHHRVASAPRDLVEPEPIPLPLSLAFREDLFEQQETLPIADLEDLLPTRFKHEAVMEDSSAKDEEEEELIDDDSIVYEEDLDQTASLEELPRLMVHKDPLDSGNLDSAYVSGSDFSTEIHTEVLDKPRLASEEDCHSVKRKRDVTVDSAFHDDVIGVH
ncbi:unnamed protein product [Caenorhabditis sp. 36 PRJEB53466]|nr:unnamed protein product [Caenorhabditis sp. 36 PRJEB53466]